MSAAYVPGCIIILICGSRVFRLERSGGSVKLTVQGLHNTGTDGKCDFKDAWGQKCVSGLGEREDYREMLVHVEILEGIARLSSVSTGPRLL
jgi:hypothetical protein